MLTAVFVSLILISMAHSYLGERFLVTPTIHSGALPSLLGSQRGAARTLRASWHLLSLMWLAIAAFVLGIALGAEDSLQIFYAIMATTFAIHTAIPLILGKGRHKSWVLFLLITVLFSALAISN